MQTVRLIARLDVKAPNLIKGVQLEGLRVIGDPHEYAHKYYLGGIDEIIYMDIVASLYQRNSLTEVIKRTCRDVFVPVTVGGGIASVDAVREVLRFGADKVAINTAATKRPELITEVSRRFGAQCMVLSIEAKRKPGGGWQAYTDNGRETTGLDVVQWAKRGAELGAGEILLTSVDREGTRTGFDTDLIAAVTSVVDIPVIASGGMGTVDHLVSAVKQGNCGAVAVADALHFARMTPAEIKAQAADAGISMRPT
ncbi:MAG: imidazole glycerol phosphate synthase subunit HisF [Rhizobiales bacterium]|nr:imidazole glycerol phosphate synthase subunit HisF [Hyphomicrobiales bacterium]OJY43017.1 MAG: imidazole glycerol phosphate synthase subunit HisF [Rhizobiales bacterium 64-17]